jgi:hypothetical protein
LRGNVCVRTDPEVVISSDPLDEVFLWRILVEELEAIRARSHQAVEHTQDSVRRALLKILKPAPQGGTS